MVGGGAVALANAVVVSGAGTAAANGTYEKNGEQNGRPKYAGGAVEVFWNGGAWVLTESSVTLYSSSNDVLKPWQAQWMDVEGAQPAPTLSPARA
jgi:hypothetical protein